ncbi:glycosyltransferase family 2 protein [Peribacillus loiseleuriae]|uniref:glycosyltransferase family 2 protein n=1 Tax=Peribacillus loiseleuriae TaxID=1679170 RepID=UPI003D019F07
MKERLKISAQKILIIVPAYNEQASIAKTLRELVDFKGNHELSAIVDICVINDGSVDKTEEIVREMGEVILIDLPLNLGIGGAVQTGYKYANSNHYDLAIQYDADGQHKSTELQKIIQPVLAGECDLCIGGRFVEKTSYKGSFQRRMGIFYFEKMIKLLTRVRVTDSTSGFRCVNQKVISIFAKDYPRDYPEPEVIIMLYKKGLKIKEVAVEMVAREMGESSITPWKSVYYMLKVSLSILVRKIEKGAVR